MDVVLRDDPVPRRSFAVRALPVAEARRVASARRALGSGAPVVPLAAALGEAGLLFEPWLDVTSFPGDSFDHAEAAGSALALLHRSGPPDGFPCRARGGGRGLLRWIGLEHAHVPIPNDAQRAFVHGDLHPDQVVLDERGAPLLMDLDCLGRGDPRRDLASWVADRLALEPGLELGAAAEPLLRGYGLSGGEQFEPRELAAFVADELVAQAAAAVRRLERQALARARLLLETAARLPPPVLVPASGGGLFAALDRLAEVPAERASPASVARVDVSSSGQIFLCLGLASGERWFRHDADRLVPLDPSLDAALPLSARLRSHAPAQVLSYRPGRRLVLRTEREVLKGYRPSRLDEAALAHSRASALNARRGFRVAGLRDLLLDHAALVLEPLEGVPLPVRGRSAEAYLGVGARLRAMQDEPASELRRFGADDELGVLLKWRERTGLAGVPPPAGFEEAYGELTEAARGLPEAPFVPCHRDLHDGQLLFTPQGVALLDFDLLCAADAALDPANLLAHLQLRALQGERGADENDAHACGEALLEGFDRSEEDDFSTRLRFHQATALLRLALVYGLRPRWRYLSPTLARLGRRALADVRRGAAS